MSKLGKFVFALALGLIMSLALLTTGSFAQSVNSHAASTPVQATVAHWGGCGWDGCGCGGWWGGCGCSCGCWSGCWDSCWDGCGW